MTITVKQYLEWEENNSNEIYKRIKEYNRKLKKAQKTNPAYAALKPMTTGLLYGKAFERTNRQIVAQLNRMAKMFTKENQRLVLPVKGAEIKVPRGVKIELEALAKEGNARSKKRYDEFPDVPGDVFTSLEKQNFAPITLGTAKNEKEFFKRAKTIYNRTDENFYMKGFFNFKTNYISSLRAFLPPSLAIDIISRLPDGKTLYYYQQNNEYGDYFNIEYVYDRDIKAQEKYDNISKALSALK